MQEPRGKQRPSHRCECATRRAGQGQWVAPPQQGKGGRGGGYVIRAGTTRPGRQRARREPGGGRGSPRGGGGGGWGWKSKNEEPPQRVPTSGRGRRPSGWGRVGGGVGGERGAANAAPPTGTAGGGGWGGWRARPHVDAGAARSSPSPTAGARVVAGAPAQAGPRHGTPLRQCHSLRVFVTMSNIFQYIPAMPIYW